VVAEPDSPFMIQAAPEPPVWKTDALAQIAAIREALAALEAAVQQA
jgi:hypothetical protein